MEYLSLFVKSIFVDNMIFAYFLGMCSYLAVSKNVKTAVGLGAAVTFVLIVTLPVNYLLENYVLAPNALIDIHFERELPNQAARKKQSTPLFREFPRRLPTAAEFREA